MKRIELPLHKSELLEQFKLLSFQTALLNIDLIAIRIKKSWEVVIITFRGAIKTGFIYEAGNLKPEQVFRVFSDVPKNWNELDIYEKKFAEKVEILYPPHHDFFIVSEKEIQEVKLRKVK